MESIKVIFYADMSLEVDLTLVGVNLFLFSPLLIAKLATGVHFWLQSTLRISGGIDSHAMRPDGLQFK